ncbi:MAG TPA: hypothetical protein VF707_07605 [Ardenticatenaceae bacterium]|jgi:hypothetical protein
MASDVERLLGLGVVAVLALGAVSFLLWITGEPRRRHGALVLGYPPDLFPARHLTQSGMLLALAAVQARLVSIYRQIPAESETGLWLEAFLKELREIMNTAYRVVVVTEIYGRPTALESLVAEVEQLERQVVEHITQRLLARDGDAQEELLDARLEMLRVYMQELARLSASEGIDPRPKGHQE